MNTYMQPFSVLHQLQSIKFEQTERLVYQLVISWRFRDFKGSLDREKH